MNLIFRPRYHTASLPPHPDNAMCVNYAPVQRQILRDIFGVEPPADEWRAEAWQDYAAPIVRAGASGRESVLGTFGMTPRAQLRSGQKLRSTMNARSETIGELVSFAKHWKAARLCLLPAMAFFEPRYDEGEKSTRWRIGLASGEPFAIAGLWRDWPNGSVSFTMPTLNADRHPFLSQFHRPGDEKRSVVILPREDWDDWLACRDPERARTFLRLLPPDLLTGEPAPLAPRKKTAAAPDTQLSLSDDN